MLMFVFGVAGWVNYLQTGKGAVTCGVGSIEPDDYEVYAIPPHIDAAKLLKGTF